MFRSPSDAPGIKTINCLLTDGGLWRPHLFPSCSRLYPKKL